MTEYNAAVWIWVSAAVFIGLALLDLKYGLDRLPRNALSALKNGFTAVRSSWTPNTSPVTPTQRQELVPCPECDRYMQEKDIEIHREAQHIDDDDDRREVYREEISRGDLVDDYGIPEDWESEESEATPVPKPSEETSRDPLGNYRPYYDRIVNELEARGKVTITGNTHVGSVRGYHVVQKFKSAVRRHPDDSIDQYELRDSGGCPVEIRVA